MVEVQERMPEVALEVPAGRAPLGLVPCYLLGLLGGTIGLSLIHQLGALLRP